ncbi:MAG: hypothetical protein AAF548_05750 [Actinomycetota bacterium]
MGKASSSKKVQRAARAAANSRGAGERRERGFPLIVALIVILGVGLVIAARASRDELVAPLIDDHWHVGYEIYDCGELRPQLLNERGPDGIHTHGDSLIHIHPTNSSATGEDARLSVFMDGAGLTVNNDRVVAAEAGFADIDNTTGCDGEDSVIQIARYEAGNNETPVTVYENDLSEVRFLQDLETLIIAKIPVGGEMPTPSDTVQAALASHDLSLASENPFTIDPVTGEVIDPLTGEPIDLGDLTDDGATDDGATDDGAIDDGATDDGTTDDGAIDDGATDDGSTDDGSTDDGTTDDGTTDDSTDGAVDGATEGGDTSAETDGE